MKKRVEVIEVEGEGFEKFIGEQVVLLCNYFYAGTLVGVNADFVLLENAKIVYETGPWNAASWKNAEPLPKPVYVMKSKIESFMGCIVK